MFLNCCPNVYSLILKTQIQFIDPDILLQIDLKDSYQVILKKDFLHIYKKGEPISSFKLHFPNLIKWKFDKGLIGFTIDNETYLTEETYKLKEYLNGRLFFSKIQDFYTPLQILGKGGNAKVLLVKQKIGETYYAAKCIPKTESIIQEIEINNLLDHPAFVKIKEVFLGDTSYYIIMDLLSGKNLLQLLKNQHSGLTVEQSKLIMHALLSGIDYMHSKNIIHRDIKPENIVLEKINNLTTLKLVDFGLATYSNIKKFKYPKCGTPGYVAPEIANLTDQNSIYDKKCDIFSAGAVFYKLLTGRDVFPGTGFAYVLAQNKKCQIDFTLLQLRKLPSDVIILLKQMLQKDPILRPTAQECLKFPFFTSNKQNETDQQPITNGTQNSNSAPTGPSNAHKRQFFAQQKQMMQTVDFPTEEKTEYKGSFVTNDMVQYPQMPKMVMKFNTTEFETI
ncbi:unnamed protein product [Paramecium pentaurelia]|uniref:Protein kinase domain-containing protein n=1 Tax=Paramecium pentaurelia TaxID=43138 RepID=A0A8S1W6J3_9CILI|nr:unnamed protein product [Paramecium pentaurelia]